MANKVVTVSDYLIRKDPEKYAELLGQRSDKQTEPEDKRDRQLAIDAEIIEARDTRIFELTDQNEKLQKVNQEWMQAFKESEKEIRKLKKEIKASHEEDKCIDVL